MPPKKLAAQMLTAHCRIICKSPFQKNMTQRALIGYFSADKKIQALNLL